MDFIIHEYIKIIENYLRGIFADDGQTNLVSAMNYSLLAGGKRIRPMLTLMCCEALGINKEYALPLAAAVEMVHTYSLIHDDLPAMDNDELRRGVPTCHKQFDEATAILAGDGLLTYAFEHISKSYLSDNQKVKAISALSGAAGPKGMILGQVLDMNLSPKTEYDILNMYKSKTGELLNAAAALGAIAADGDGNEFLEYSSCIGTAFQIKDDILDIEGSEEKLGKPVGSDDKNKKNTIVNFIGIDRSKKLVDEYTKRAIEFSHSLGERGKLFVCLAEMLLLRNN
jgi:geranylgeranyl diphosphate synthase type II